jgi:hypothetical protein
MVAPSYLANGGHINPVAARNRAPRGKLPSLGTPVVLAVFLLAGRAAAAENPVVERFQDDVQPILIDYCYRCHADGTKRGGIAFDELPLDKGLVAKPDFWWAVLKNVRAGIMPPPRKPRPSDQEVNVLAAWIKRDAFGIDPANLDPGRATIRRLNRVEYRNTIRDLTGFDFKAEEEFPPDDSGYGFDNIGDVLSVSPLLLEKYLQAAESIVGAAVPTVARRVPERTYRGAEFRAPEGAGNGERLSFYKKAKVSRLLSTDPAGEFQLALDLGVDGSFDFDPGRCRVTVKLDDKELLKQTYAWEDNKTYRYSFTETLAAGDHRLSFELEPLPSAEKRRPSTSVDFRISAVKLQGPLDPKHWKRLPNYDRFFFKGEPPPDDAQRRQYTREILARFATSGFRRPVDDRSLDRLVAIAEAIYRQPGGGFEAGVSRAMVAVLASPRFVFRVEGAEAKPGQSEQTHPLVDEYALAVRLSYFLWSTMPDAELFLSAERGELRKELSRHVKRMQADARAGALTRNFVGQWLQVRDVEGLTINTRAVLRQDGIRTRLNLDGDLRRAMRREAEMLFEQIVHEDRSVLDLIDSDYIFVNGKLADLYGIKDVTGSQMRRVELPKNSQRGGVLTAAATLMVTSNPTRTSPVKRGQFVLDNILGIPAPPPPAAVPPLEEAKKDFKGTDPTVRDLLALHRAKPLCSSCHARMDPLGLAFENFNALGLWRDKERGQPIDAAGKLTSGESFHDVSDLKRILKTEHHLDFFRCLTEKLLTYALGRGLDYHDVETVDRIVERLDREGGRFSALVMGVIESAPFQRRRSVSAATAKTAGANTRSFQARSKP